MYNSSVNTSIDIKCANVLFFKPTFEKRGKSTDNRIKPAHLTRPTS